jgi:hypothetical protein
MGGGGGTLKYILRKWNVNSGIQVFWRGPVAAHVNMAVKLRAP